MNNVAANSHQSHWLCFFPGKPRNYTYIAHRSHCPNTGRKIILSRCINLSTDSSWKLGFVIVYFPLWNNLGSESGSVADWRFGQVAACYGLLTIHWKELKGACKRCLDQDGDGKLDCKDCKIILQKSFTYVSIS